MHHHPQSRKRESRIRTGDGRIRALPNDLHRELSEQKEIHGYETLWATAVQAMRHGVRVLRAQADRADEMVNGTGTQVNRPAPRRIQI